ncbi:AbrB/MazE/SpoVT family DNA-binding domain-containing protein [Patescibacteria group bacterium]|nr:AbrB/MazE/SpoVT family DNA-binding domain-containing protein [Patescibacteria group bacterium]
MKNVIYEDAGRVMSRGQLVIPIEIRKRAGLIGKSLVRILLTSDKNIVIEPMKGKNYKLSSFLRDMSEDYKVYWSKEDDLKRKKIKALSTKRLKKLVW